jgi:hypothetical protein
VEFLRERYKQRRINARKSAAAAAEAVREADEPEPGLRH